jgi:hypothetical protein
MTVGIAYRSFSDLIDVSKSQIIGAVKITLNKTRKK